MYFWENNYQRALQWAEDKKKRGQIETPAVIGAVLFLGYCCDFMDSKYIQTIQFYYKTMAIAHKITGKKLPKNRDHPHDIHKDKIMRDLDCATIEFMHDGVLQLVKTEIRKNEFIQSKIFDSTRGVFTEGGPAFEGAGIFEKSHIQICIRNLNCIKGFFLPRREIDFPQWRKKGKSAA